jgi:tRNA nucleotidyltransferase (CCA-adding enzyme)
LQEPRGHLPETATASEIPVERVSVARRAHTYPQVSLTAADLVDTPVVVAPPSITVGDALRLSRRRHARVLACGAATHVLVEDLARADTLGLGELAAAEVSQPLPVVEAQAPELRVRRALTDGAPVVIVRGRSGGAIARGASPRAVSLVARVNAALSPATREVLDAVTRLAAAHGGRAFLAGGLVRDVWRGETSAARDLDVVIEGDGPGVARALASELGGALVEHERFLTASVATARHGRIDVVTARTERYERPGALPRVLPGSMAQDLRRRDFAVNAMAVELGSGAFGLLDPLGGVTDLERRRLRILHPLSFVEDPTRMLRAVRYAARLGLTADRWTLRCQALALRLAPYPALSASRLAGELERLLSEPSPGAVLALAVRGGVMRLLDPGWRPSRATATRLAALNATLEWAAAHRLATPLAVTALALASEQRPTVATAMPERLGLSGELLSRVRRALEEAPHLATRVRATRSRSEAARLLREAGDVALTLLHLTEPEARERLDWYVREGRTVAPGLGGDEVIALGVPRGPMVSEVLQTLRDGRLDGRFGDREAELRYVRSLTIRDERKG